MPLVSRTLRVTSHWAFPLVVVIAGCAHGSGQGPVDPGRPHAPPRLASLPRIPEASSASSSCTRQGLLAARAALQAGLPAPPEDRRQARLQAWVEGEVARWIRARQAAVQETRYEFQVGGEPSPSERIVQRAVVGLLHEDTAAEITRIPPPAELASEPEVEAMFGDIMRAQAKPFLAAALVEFRECPTWRSTAPRTCGTGPNTAISASPTCGPCSSQAATLAAPGPASR